MNNNTKKKHPAAYLLALVPAVFAGIYMLLFFIPDTVSVEFAGLAILKPIGQQDMPEFSLVALLIAVATVFCWGWIGKLYSRAGIGILPAMITSHAIPLVCAVLYCVFTAIEGESAGAVFALGFGTVNILGNIIYSMVALNYVEIIADLVIMLGAFAVGYSTGVAGSKKAK